jgi:hydroxypyruvate reductase
MRKGLERISANGSILAVTNYENVPDVADFPVMGSAHPLPDANGIAAGAEVVEILSEAGADDHVVLLLSGGGSALLPCPAGEMSLEDKMAVTDLLLKSGADITEINQVRRALSKLKGGGFAELAAPTKVTAFILSDVPGDDLKDIASGPTVPGSTDPAAARAVLEKFSLWDRIPSTAQQVLSAEAGAVGDIRVDNHLIGANSISVAAMASSGAEIVSDWLEGPVAEAATLFVELIAKGPGIYVCGGETAVEVTGSGLGGRNQEMAMRVAMLAEERGLDGAWAFLSGGTDGRDGPTEAAGGIVDYATAARMRDGGVDPEALLADNDSFHALKASGDLVMTGGTGTNVADLQILIVG